MSFRITIQSPTDASLVVRLEGRLARADLPILEACLGEVGNRPIALDLAELRWLDAAAAARVADLVRAGATVVASSPFVERLLAEAPADSPSPRASANHAPDSHGP